MSTSTIDTEGKGGTPTGFSFGKPLNIATDADTTTPFVINDSNSAVLGDVTIAVNVVDGAGTAITADSTTVTESFKLQPKSFVQLSDVATPAIVVNADDTISRFNTSTVTFTDVITTHATSAAANELLYVAFA